MTAAVHDQITSAAKEILGNEPEGLKTGVLTNRIEQHLPNLTLRGIHHDLLEYIKRPDALIYQPARGWFRHSNFKEGAPPAVVPPVPASEKVYEQAFYEPFAKWLVEDLEECTRAIVIGGAILKDRWGTPDVMGVLSPNMIDLLQFPIEVVSAEIKVSTDALITAFGQACSYKLFSHKSYIVVPDNAPTEDIDKLDSLSLIFGIGLIVFDACSPGNPRFQIRTRATKHEPDMFYVNEKIVRLGKVKVKELFG